MWQEQSTTHGHASFRYSMLTARQHETTGDGSWKVELRDRRLALRQGSASEFFLFGSMTLISQENAGSATTEGKRRSQLQP